MASEDVDKLSMSQRWTCEVAGFGFLPGESYSGGNPQVDDVDGTCNDSPFGEGTAGQGSVDEVTLVNFVTPTCKVWRDVYTKTFVNKDKDHRFDCTINLLDESGNIVQSTNYFDCTMTSYDMPTCVAGSGELLRETVSFRPQRAEVKGG